MKLRPAVEMSSQQPLRCHWLVPRDGERLRAHPFHPRRSNGQKEQGTTVSTHTQWHDTQREIATCEECIGRWKGLVTQPYESGKSPTLLHCENSICRRCPNKSRGKDTGNHFLSAAGDNLRNGLFRLLEERFDIPLGWVGFGGSQTRLSPRRIFLCSRR